MIELRRIRTDEWQVFKTLRLAALEHDGERFGQSYAEVSLLSDEKWQEDTAKAAESDEFYAMLAFDQARPVGMSACVRREDFGKIIMVWVDPQYRGSGIGRLLVDKTMAEAGAPSYKLTVVEGNTPAIRTYERLGFTPTGFAYTNSKGLREMEMVLAGGIAVLPDDSEMIARPAQARAAACSGSKAQRDPVCGRDQGSRGIHERGVDIV